MSPPGRPKGNRASAGKPAPTTQRSPGARRRGPGRAHGSLPLQAYKGEYRSAQHEGNPATLVVGLTGGIGSGKSAVAREFAALGASVTDTDLLAHALTAPGEPGHAAVLAAFGPEFRLADGTLDRARLRRLVFDDAAARGRLEAILHPLIRAATQRELAAWTGPYGLLVVPLLYERGGLSGVARVLVVDCPEDEQVRRVVARSGLATADVRAIMATQLPRADRLARADDILDNAGPMAAIVPQVAELDRRYRALAAAAVKNRGRAAR
jgi:dephospho-CoA kinase